MGGTRSLKLKKTFSASQERLFAMWTSADLMKQWFCPGSDMTVPIAEVDARAGGSYRIVMQSKDGETYSPSGVYETVRPYDKLVFSWKWADSEVITRVTLDLRAVSDSETELTLTHEGFPDVGMRDKHNEGWDGCLARLAEAA
ncbi:MAG: SRPBCC domain-containing protein [Proteobacteria bacterium]|nr:SRPBCC domain-containing protein [Pseudomonadota bacterium]